MSSGCELPDCVEVCRFGWAMELHTSLRKFFDTDGVVPVLVLRKFQALGPSSNVGGGLAICGKPKAAPKHMKNLHQWEKQKCGKTVSLALMLAIKQAFDYTTRGTNNY